LSGLPLDLPAHPVEGDSHSWHLYILRVRDDAPLGRDALFAGLAERGITCSVHYTPLHEFTYWRETYDLEPQHFPAAARAGAGAISLPLFPTMTDAQQDHVVASLRDLLGG